MENGELSAKLWLPACKSMFLTVAQSGGMYDRLLSSFTAIDSSGDVRGSWLPFTTAWTLFSISNDKVHLEGSVFFISCFFFFFFFFLGCVLLCLVSAVLPFFWRHLPTQFLERLL